MELQRIMQLLNTLSKKATTVAISSKNADWEIAEIYPSVDGSTIYIDILKIKE